MKKKVIKEIKIDKKIFSFVDFNFTQIFSFIELLFFDALFSITRTQKHKIKAEIVSINAKMEAIL